MKDIIWNSLCQYMIDSMNMRISTISVKKESRAKCPLLLFLDYGYTLNSTHDFQNYLIILRSLMNFYNPSNRIFMVLI